MVIMAHPMLQDNIWFDKFRYEDAEKIYEERKAQAHSGLVVEGSSTLVNEIARAREHIQKSLSSAGQGLAVGVGVDNSEIFTRLQSLETENQGLRKVTADLQAVVAKLESRIAALELENKSAAGASAAPPAAAAAAAAPADEDEDDDDDEVDLFGSDSEEDEEAERIKAERVKAYEAKKAKKPALIAKSNIILDVKPWDDETDMKEMEEKVRSLKADGLLWGASKLVPVGYGIKKLQIACVVEDDKVGTDWLEEAITEFEDYVQSVDIAAFNKV